MDEDIFATIAMVIGVIALIVFILFFGAFIVMLLWNGLMVPLFGAPVLSFWQTYGLMIMVRLILPTNISTRKKD